MSDKRVVVLSSKRFENLFTRENFFTRNDAEHMIKAKQELDKCIDKDGVLAYLNSRMVRHTKS